MQIPPGIRAILFDAVGTLIYPDPPVAEVYCREGRKLGSRYSSAEVGPRFRAAIARHQQEGITNETLERERWRRIVYAVIDDVDDPAGQLLNSLWEHFGAASNWRLFGDVASLWRELTSRGYLLGIASNFDSRLLAICQCLPTLESCRHIFVSSEIGCPKPEMQFYRSVEKYLGLLPEQILLIGDDYIADVSGPLEGGWQARWLRRDQGETLDQAVFR